MSAPVSLLGESRFILCRDCGTAQPLVPLGEQFELRCPCCGALLESGHGRWLPLAMALAATALVLFVISHAFTFITLKLAGLSQSATILSGVVALLERDQWLLATTVLTTLFLYPLLEICGLLFLLIPYYYNRPLRGQRRVLRYLTRAQPWNMMDVFTLGVLVTTVKLRDEANVVPGEAFYALFVLVAVLQWAYRVVDQRDLWHWLSPFNCFANSGGEPLVNCRACQALVGVSIVESSGACPRCRQRVVWRNRSSLQRCFALCLAAAILYIPANVLPIMHYRELGVVYDSTIVGGVLDLINAGLYVVAMIVFVASLVVPILKLCILFYLIYAAARGAPGGPRAQTLLYRIVEIIGRWSMVDVFVVTLLTAVVQFGFIGTVEPGAALVPFAVVVVLTMLAADAFDPRLLWDRAGASPPPPNLDGLQHEPEAVGGAPPPVAVEPVPGASS